MITYRSDKKLLNIHRTTREQLDDVVPDASAIDRSWDIRSVHVTGVARNIESLGAIKSISDLYLWGNALKAMPESWYSLPLRSLEVTNNPITEIRFEEWSCTLESLTLRGLRCLADLEAIDKCSRLQALCLDEIRKAKTFPAMQGLSQLKSVTLACFRSWPSLAGLMDSPRLKTVWLRKVSVSDDSLELLRERSDLSVTVQA